LKVEERKEVLEQRNLFGFIRQTVPVALPGTTIWLALSWLFLILSLFASLFSQFTSQYGLMRSCEELDREYLQRLAERLSQNPSFKRGITPRA
jgi:hypothetical protein